MSETEYLPGQMDIQDAMRAETTDEEASTPPPTGDSSLLQYAEELVKLKEDLGAAEEEVKNLRARYNELRGQVIPELMNDLGMVGPDGKGSFTLATGEKLFIKNDLHAGCNKADEDALFDWLRERGDGSLIKETVHAGTLKAYIKELLENGETQPEFVKVHTFQTINIRRR